LEVEQGPEFLEGQFELTDSEGYSYGSGDPILGYWFESGKRLGFVIPYGIAAGPASLSLGAEGRGPYEFGVEIVRLFGALSTSGRLTFHDISSPDRTRGTAQVGTGPGSIGLSASGDRLVAVAQGAGEVHFLEVRADELVPFAPSLNLGFPLKRAALVSTGALVAADQGVAYIERDFEGRLVLNKWLSTGPVTSIAAAADEGRAVAVGTTTDASPMDVLFRLNVAVRPPEITSPTIILGGSSGGVADVAISPAGGLAVSVNTLDEQVTLVNLLDVGQALRNFPLPAECLAPSRIIMARRGNYLAVLCPGSKVVAIYEVDGGGILSLGAVAADPRTGDPAQASAPVDAGFAPPRTLMVLLADGAVSQMDLGQGTLAAALVRGAQDGGGSALVVQP
ncbi:MAG: hypothetical protein RBU30_12590, partial [Polyangia bacterium]|nr:hypothetical protein [Polyangia bacterium]